MKFDVTQSLSAATSGYVIKTSARTVYLHDFPRAGGQVVRAKQQSLKAFARLRCSVTKSLESGFEYPRPDLIAMAPQKFFSDIVESILGAIYLDTVGDLSICEAFLERLNVLTYIRHILDDEVETTSPKEQMGILTGQQSVQYIASTNKAEDGTTSFDCTARVGETDVAKVERCGSKEEAEVRAAWEAVQVLKAEAAERRRPNDLKRKIDVVMGADMGNGPIRNGE